MCFYIVKNNLNMIQTRQIQKKDYDIKMYNNMKSKECKYLL